MGRYTYHGEIHLPWGDTPTMGGYTYHGEIHLPWGGTPTGTIIKRKNSDTSLDCDDTISCQLDKIRSTNINNVVIGLLNINSVIRKF